MRPATLRQTIRFEPGVMTWTEAADYACRRSESWLRSHISELEGFPRPDPALNVFAAEAVRAWVRRRFGLAGPTDDAKTTEDALLGRLQNGKRQGAVSRRAAS